MGDRVWAAIDSFYESQKLKEIAKPKRKPSGKRTEFDEQKDIIKLLKNLDIIFTSVSNGGYRLSVQAAGKLRQAGLQRGFPDLVLLSRPPAERYHLCRGVALEVKRSKASGPSRLAPEQREWLKRLSDDCGWACFVVYGIDDAIAVLRELGWLEKSAA